MVTRSSRVRYAGGPDPYESLLLRFSRDGRGILKIVPQYDMHHSTNRPIRYDHSLERLKGTLIGSGVSIRVGPRGIIADAFDQG